MNLFIESHQVLLKELINAHVDFIIIGGYAVIFYGYMRTTGDVDIWLKADNENKKKLLSALEKVGVSKNSLEQVSEYDFTKDVAFSIWEEPQKADFITRINLVTFEEADKEKVIADIDGLKVPFIHFNHLILSKISTDRGKDKGDIDELRKISKLKRKGKNR